MSEILMPVPEGQGRLRLELLSLANANIKMRTIILWKTPPPTVAEGRRNFAERFCPRKLVEEFVAYVCADTAAVSTGK